MRFKFPAWDEVDGIEYQVAAANKADAVKAGETGNIGCFLLPLDFYRISYDSLPRFAKRKAGPTK